MSKSNFFKNIPVEGNTDFDWSLYQDGYTGGNSMVLNKRVKTKGKEKIYSHESYAQELYNIFSGSKSVMNSSKDVIKGTVYNVTNILPVSKTEVSVDTDCGLSAVIDLAKEKQFLDAFHAESMEEFINNIKMAGYKEAVLNQELKIKAMDNDRLSLWEGLKSGLENEFMEQITSHNPKFAYKAKIEAINGGGYIVNISGIKCFLPGSLAAAGVITDFESMLGKVVPVMVVNYIPKSGFVVSYKKYLETILPSKIQKELEPGMKVNCKITGLMTNSIFVQFKDNEGEYIYSGLVHRTTMSKSFEASFDKRSFKKGDEMWLYISSIVNDNGKYKIVLSDMTSLEEYKEDSKKSE